MFPLLPTYHMSYHRRKFRSQTSDNMDKWKSRGGKSQRREEKRREEERRSEKRQSQKKEDAGAQKGRKVAKPCVFHCFSMFFPRASERRVLLIVGACQTFSHLRIFKSSHLLILASSHLHILTSSHLLIFTSSHPHIFTSSHLHILSCPFPALLPSCSLALFFFLLFYFSLKARGSANEDGTKRNPFARNEVRSPKNWSEITILPPPRQPFRPT